MLNHIVAGEDVETEDPCDDCRRVLSAMSVEPPPDAKGLAFPDCRLAPCWCELERERVVGELDTQIPF